MWRANGSAVPPTDANLNSISLEYSYDDVARASRNFSPGQLLGRGSYGEVYKGILKDGTEVAIKVLNNPKDSGFKEEVLVLSKFRHPNLVILMGFSRNNKGRFLIYELLPGGDLCSRIQSDPSFDWRRRLTACLDAALGLSHLHNASPKVFHRDIKTQNILLDRNGTAKMADFGLALLAQPQQGVRVEQCSGTLGYADPLYISSSVVTEKSEVYSFGMVLLEALTGRPPAVQGNNGQVVYVYQNIHSNPQSLFPMVQARAGWPPEVAQRMIRLALACTDKEESRRPIFVHVVARMRDLVSRFVSNTVQYSSPSPIAQPAQQLLQNQRELEEVFKKVNKCPPERAGGWNPFDDPNSLWAKREEVSQKAGDVGTVPKGDTSKPVPTGVVPPLRESAPKDESTKPLPTGLPAVVKPPSVTTPPEPKHVTAEVVNKLVLSAVAEFDEELRSMSSAKETADVDSAMSILFPSTDSCEPEKLSDSSKRRENHSREVARHLISAGFSLEQIRLALQRSSSVEAAVEWILDQQW